jgi:hypothetical protein
LGGATVVYRSGYLSNLLDSGRRSAQRYLSGLSGSAASPPGPRIGHPQCPPT